MRALVIATLICCLAGCGSEPSAPAPSGSKVDQAKLAKAKAAYTAFLDEAVKGADLLASHPDGDKLEEQIKKLQGLLDQASDVYPDHKRMSEVAMDCKGMIRYFSASLSTIKYHAKSKAPISESVKKRIDEVSDKNADAVRKTVDRTRTEMGA